MIGTTLIGIFFLYSHEESIPSYRTICYQILGSGGRTIKSFFKDSISFIPETFEILLHRIEQSDEEITLFEQQLSFKLNPVGDTCDETLDIGRFTFDKSLLRHHNFTLHFGEQKFVVDQYQFMLTDRTPEGIYNIEGIYGRSLIQIRVVNAKSTFDEYYYDGPFYDHKPQIADTIYYCLKLWNKFQEGELFMVFMEKLTKTLPPFVTVHFEMEREPSINATDLGHLYLCPGLSSTHNLNIHVGRELAEGRIVIRLLDPHNRQVAQTVYGLNRYEKFSPLTDHSDYYFYNLLGTLDSLQSCTGLRIIVSTWDMEKDVMLYRYEFKTRRCDVSGHQCIVDEYLHDGAELHTQGLCKTSFDPNDKFFVWKRFPKTQYAQCTSKWRASHT